ncbi:SET domain-containing protein [Lentinus brumalis]|nr:SET domain-containing protein [Polyporus brumalis]
MRRGFLLSTPREPRKAAPAEPRPSSSSKPSEQENKSTAQVPSTTVIPLPARYIFRPLDPEYPPDIWQRTVDVSEFPQAGVPPEQRTVFVHYNGVVDALRAQHPGWPQAFSSPSPPVYKIVPIDGAGLGMVATADITAGEVIVRERPLLLSPKALPTQDREALACLTVGLVQFMNPENRRAFYALKNCKGKTMPTEEDGIINTNSFMCGPFPTYEGRYCGVARECSRANHSCSPNAKHCFDPATLTQSLRAFRDIRAGEEITVSYIDFYLPSEKRKEELKRRYFFDCRCAACRLTGQARQQSDTARAFVNACGGDAMIAKVEAAFEEWLAAGAQRTAPVVLSPGLTQLDPFGMAEVLWDTMVREGCYNRGLWEPLLTRLVKGYAVLENAERVRFYATKAAQLRTLYTEEDGGWRAVADNPRQTEWWAKLGAKRIR